MNPVFNVALPKCCHSGYW